MEQKSGRQKNIGLFAFFISGICAISSGIIVSLLQENYGFSYGMTGTLLSLMNIGNLTAGFSTGILPGKIGLKRTILFLTFGYFTGYLLMSLSNFMLLLILAFFLLGIAKGSTINICTILVKHHSTDSTKGMNLMHSCYALGALLCPFLITIAATVNFRFPMILLALCGLLSWLVFLFTLIDTKQNQKNEKPDWSFLHSKKFWILTGLLFCQNAAETSVVGWMVTYFKGSGILTGFVSTYAVTVMWSATLIARLLIAFVFSIKRPSSAMIKMGIGCIIFYIGLMLSNTQSAAIPLLFSFAFSMAGLNPIAVASAGRMTSITSMGVMLPAASSGAILMPWIIGILAEHWGIHVGMAANIIPCIGILLFCLALMRLEQPQQV